MFCNVDSSDYTLQNVSPCLGTGFNGADMGAFGLGCLEYYAGPVWYVSVDGSDSLNSGNQTGPFATIQKGIDAAAIGDTILVGPGTYYEHLNISQKVLISHEGERIPLLMEVQQVAYCLSIKRLLLMDSPSGMVMSGVVTELEFI